MALLGSRLDYTIGAPPRGYKFHGTGYIQFRACQNNNQPCPSSTKMSSHFVVRHPVSCQLPLPPF
jgi:hypothetical protein